MRCLVNDYCRGDRCTPEIPWSGVEFCTQQTPGSFSLSQDGTHLACLGILSLLWPFLGWGSVWSWHSNQKRVVFSVLCLINACRRSICGEGLPFLLSNRLTVFPERYPKFSKHSRKSGVIRFAKGNISLKICTYIINLQYIYTLFMWEVERERESKHSHLVIHCPHMGRSWELRTQSKSLLWVAGTHWPELSHVPLGVPSAGSWRKEQSWNSNQDTPKWRERMCGSLNYQAKHLPPKWFLEWVLSLIHSTHQALSWRGMCVCVHTQRRAKLCKIW